MSNRASACFVHILCSTAIFNLYDVAKCRLSLLGVKQFEYTPCRHRSVRVSAPAACSNLQIGQIPLSKVPACQEW